MWLCLAVIDASPVAAPDTNEALDLQSACARMDIRGFSEAAKALCGAVGTWIKSQGRPVCSCSRCAPGVGGGISCALFGNKWNQQPSKRKRRLTLKRVSFQFFVLFTSISSSRIFSESLTSQTSLLRKIIYLADHCPEKNVGEYTESILWPYLFCGGIIPSAKLVHICWIPNLYASAPNLSHSSVNFRWK